MPKTLLKRLLEIERAVGQKEPSAVRRMLMEAQMQVLTMEQEQIAMFEELRRLRATLAERNASLLCRSCRMGKTESIPRLVHLAS